MKSVQIRSYFWSVFFRIWTLFTQNERTIHQHNIKFPKKEIHKFENDRYPPLIHDMFQVRKNTFSETFFQVLQIIKKTVKMNLETISYRAPEFWNLVPAEIKQSTSLSTFKEKRHGTAAIVLVVYTRVTNFVTNYY